MATYIQNQSLPEPVYTEEQLKSLFLEANKFKGKRTTQFSGVGIPNFGMSPWNMVTSVLTILGLPAAPVLPTEVILGNSLFVTSTGNDSTGIRERVDLPFLTIAAALDAASSGDTIFISPGTYTTTRLVESGIKVHLAPGAQVDFTGTSLDFDAYAGIYGSGTIAFNSTPLTTGLYIVIEADLVFFNSPITFSNFDYLNIDVNTAIVSDAYLLRVLAPSINATTYLSARSVITSFASPTAIIELNSLVGNEVTIELGNVAVNRLPSVGFITTKNTDVNSNITLIIGSWKFLAPATEVESKYPIITSSSDCFAWKAYTINNITTTGMLYDYISVGGTPQVERGFMKFTGELVPYVTGVLNTYIRFTKPLQAIVFQLDIVDNLLVSNAILDISGGQSQTISGRITSNSTNEDYSIIEYSAASTSATLDNLTVVSILKSSIRNKAVGANGIRIKSFYSNVATNPDNGGVTQAFGGILIIDSNIV